MVYTSLLKRLRLALFPDLDTFNPNLNHKSEETWDKTNQMNVAITPVYQHVGKSLLLLAMVLIVNRLVKSGNVNR